jgi:hypothetical protein
VMIAGTMIIFFIRLCWWKKCCQTDQMQAYPTPTWLKTRNIVLVYYDLRQCESQKCIV